MQRRMRLEGQLSKLQRVPDDPTPLQQHINDLVRKHSCAFNPRHRHRMVRMPPLYLASQEVAVGYRSQYSRTWKCKLGYCPDPWVPQRLGGLSKCTCYNPASFSSALVFVGTWKPGVCRCTACRDCIACCALHARAHLKIDMHGHTDTSDCCAKQISDSACMPNRAGHGGLQCSTAAMLQDGTSNMHADKSIEILHSMRQHSCMHAGPGCGDSIAKHASAFMHACRARVWGRASRSCRQCCGCARPTCWAIMQASARRSAATWARTCSDRMYPSK